MANRHSIDSLFQAVRAANVGDGLPSSGNKSVPGLGAFDYRSPIFQQSRTIGATAPEDTLLNVSLPADVSPVWSIIVSCPQGGSAQYALGRLYVNGSDLPIPFDLPFFQVLTVPASAVRVTIDRSVAAARYGGVLPVAPAPSTYYALCVPGTVNRGSSVALYTAFTAVVAAGGVATPFSLGVIMASGFTGFDAIKVVPRGGASGPYTVNYSIGPGGLSIQAVFPGSAIANNTQPGWLEIPPYPSPNIVINNGGVNPESYVIMYRLRV